MTNFVITKRRFLDDRQGRKFADVVQLPDSVFDFVLSFFNSPDRQRRMLDSELHHDRAPLAGVVRELESADVVNRLMASRERLASLRFRQAVGVIVRMIMEAHGWRRTGRKGSLGVRRAASSSLPRYNSGGLALWFIRGERYTRDDLPFRSVRERCREFESTMGFGSSLRGGRKRRSNSDQRRVSPAKRKKSRPN